MTRVENRMQLGEIEKKSRNRNVESGGIKKNSAWNSPRSADLLRGGLVVVELVGDGELGAEAAAQDQLQQHHVLHRRRRHSAEPRSDETKKTVSKNRENLLRTTGTRCTRVLSSVVGLPRCSLIELKLRFG